MLDRRIDDHQSIDFDKLDPKKYIVIKGAKANNLRNVNIAIERYKLIVVTGVSGSGKSSLVFDTLFAESQRTYIESMSSYARQFLPKMDKPAIDYIKGLSPSIAIEQKANTYNTRSTVGTTTEIYDYLKLLYARIGCTYSPISHQKVSKHTTTDVEDYIYQWPTGTKVIIGAPLYIEKDTTLNSALNFTLRKGYTRIMFREELFFIEDFDIIEQIDIHQHPIDLIIDRIVIDKTNHLSRLQDSIQTAFFEGNGQCIVHIVDKEKKIFSDRFELDGLVFEVPSVHFFGFNNPYGLCKTCQGVGEKLGFDPYKVIPNQTLSIHQGAIEPLHSIVLKKYKNYIIDNKKFDFPINTPYTDLTSTQQKILWKGNDCFEGLDSFFQSLKTQSYQYSIFLSRYINKIPCEDCQGTRIRQDAAYVKIHGQSIIDLLQWPISSLSIFFRQLNLTAYEQQISKQLLVEINNRLDYLEQVGLGYLTLHRAASTLSGGEYQRIRLATTLSSSLVDTLYILDEPTIGLHARDTQKLIDVLIKIKKEGNTVIVVEHDEAVMRLADQIIDIGPDAGSNGGKLLFQGSWSKLINARHSHTTRYLNRIDAIATPNARRKWTQAIEIKGVRENNLNNIQVCIPLNILTVITGVSGSGKSSFAHKVLYTTLQKCIQSHSHPVGNFDMFTGDYQKITQIEWIDQHAIGRSSRSNPVTYINAYDSIRQLFSQQPMAKKNGYTKHFFSFNTPGGRCEACKGEGKITISMQFMADIILTCEDCQGKRFTKDILSIFYQGKNINDILNMTVDDAIDFFTQHKHDRIVKKINPLQEVGMGYICLGLSASVLSGGEAQRIKLASYLGKGQYASKGHILFIFDEPTIGLHTYDIHKLLKSINALIDSGHSVLIIEHNMDIIKCADWIIDFGPEGGDQGGNIVFSGTPEKMIQTANSHTAKYLRKAVV